MTDNLSCNFCFFYQAYIQFGCSFKGVRTPSYLVERCQLGKEMPDEGVCEDFKKNDYEVDIMNKQEVIRNMIEGCTMKLHRMSNELAELEERLGEVQYMMKEQEQHCNHCKKEVDDS